MHSSSRSMSEYRGCRGGPVRASRERMQPMGVGESHLKSRLAKEIYVALEESTHTQIFDTECHNLSLINLELSLYNRLVQLHRDLLASSECKD